MKDLAFMLSLWLFALKAGPMKDLASAMSGAVCPFCAIELTIVLYVYIAHPMIFMCLCHALKAGPMKDLALASVPCLGRLPSRLGL